jgi:hypothetical protein
MTMTYLPPTQELNALFVDEVRTLGCARPDIYDDGVRLIARAICTRPVEVRPGDAVRGGVALHTFDEFVDVHPFIFRQVCTNGAVMAEALQSQRIRRVEVAALSEMITAVREDVRAAIRACAAPTAFADAAAAMRRSTGHPASVLINRLPRLGAMPRSDVAAFVDRVMGRFERQGDESAFGLINAVTSLARDTKDPVRKWRLEELGGTMLALIPPVTIEQQILDRVAQLAARHGERVDICA